MLSPVPGYSPCLACALVHLLFYFMVVGKPTRGAFLPPTGLECEELLFEQCRPVGKNYNLNIQIKERTQQEQLQLF